jgi:hypothetical protein
MRLPARGVFVALCGALNVEFRFQLLYFVEHLCMARHEFSFATTVSFVVLPFTDSPKSI